MRKQERERFGIAANNLIEQFGAEENTDSSSYDWWWVTRFGVLVLTVNIAERHGRGLGSVMTRFEEPQQAIEMGCNPVSGKWNHYYFEGVTIEQALENLEGCLELVQNVKKASL